MECVQHSFSSSSLSFCCRFGSFYRTPKRTWIDEIWVERKHLVIEFMWGGGFMVQSVEIPNVVSGRRNMIRTIGLYGILMARNHSTGFEGFKSLQGSDPLEATVFACL